MLNPIRDRTVSGETAAARLALAATEGAPVISRGSFKPAGRRIKADKLLRCDDTSFVTLRPFLEQLAPNRGRFPLLETVNVNCIFKSKREEALCLAEINFTWIVCSKKEVY